MNMEDTDGVDFSEGDSFVVDLNDVEAAGDFEALPRGMYPVMIDDCEFAISQNAGNPMWSLTLVVTEGEYEDRKLFTHLVMRGKGLPITKKQLQRIAPELLEGPFDPQDEDIIDSMIGKRLKAKVSTRKYEGEMRNNVGDLFPNDEDDI